MDEKKLFFLSSPILDNIIKLEGLFPIEGGKTRIVNEIGLEPGGESNLIIEYKRLGGYPIAVGPIGKDIYSQFFVNCYKQLNISTDCLIRYDDYQMPIINSVCDEAGNHTFLSYFHGKHLDNHKLIESYMKLADGYFLNGYNLVGDNCYKETAISLMHLAKSLGLPVFFDPGPCLETISQDDLDDIFACVDVVSLNETECFALTKEENIEKAATILKEKTNALILAKAGKKGCYVASNKFLGKWYSGFEVNMVDTSGCGDVFLASFMYGYLHGFDTDTSVILANAAGASKASKYGTGRNVPTFKEICELLEDNGYVVNEESKEVEKFVDLKLEKIVGE